MMIELSNIYIVFECGYKAALYHYPLILAVMGGRGSNFQIDKSVLWDWFSTEYAKQNAKQLSDKFTGATEKADTQRQ